MNEIMDSDPKKCGCTPKRRLSFMGISTNNISPMQHQLTKNVCKKLLESEQSPQGIDLYQQRQQPIKSNNDSPSNESPFIKRKCINKEQIYYKFSRNGSPSCVSSCDLVELYTQTSESPKLLNELRTLKIANRDENDYPMRPPQPPLRNMGRRGSYQFGFQKHKSAPLSMNLNKLMNNHVADVMIIKNYANSRRQSICGLYSSSLDATTTARSTTAISTSLNISLGDDEEDDSDGQGGHQNGGGGGLDNDDDHMTSRNRLENLIFGSENGGGGGDEYEQQIMDDHHKIIKQSLEIDATCSNLIGDRSKQHILPVIPSAKHTDLYCISPETLVAVLNGHFNNQIDEYIIIDSRYPYEYEGGHIHNALNIFTKDKLFEEMFIKRLNMLNTKHVNKHHASKTMSQSASTDIISESSSPSSSASKEDTSSSETLSQTATNTSSSSSRFLGRNQSFSSGYLSDFQKELNDLSSDKEDLYMIANKFDSRRMRTESTNSTRRVIVIFHCEFSSERGPSLLRFLRNQDRALNEDCYPYLHYPELYLLEGGYKLFYENFKSYCDPQTYKPMLHAEHLNDLKHFRAKAKSWEVSNHLHNLWYLSNERLKTQRPSVTRFK